MNELIWTLVFAFLVFPAVSYGQSQTKKVELNSEFSLNIKQKAIFESNGLTIEFVSIGEDSRCPPDVNCVWAGNAEVRISLKLGTQSPNVCEINTNLEPRSITFEKFQIELRSLSGPARSDAEMKDKDYNATFIVKKM